jgi:hypothetical protein
MTDYAHLTNDLAKELLFTIGKFTKANPDTDRPAVVHTAPSELIGCPCCPQGHRNLHPQPEMF